MMDKRSNRFFRIPSYANCIQIHGTPIEYREYLPCHALASYIACFWTCTSHSVSVPQYQHRVLPDGCMDIIHNPCLSSQNNSSMVFGTMESHKIFPSMGIIDTVAVRFRPGGAFPYLKHPIHEITDQAEGLDTFLGMNGQALEEDLISSKNHQDKIDKMESFLMNQLVDAPTMDAYIHPILREIVQTKGLLSPTDIANRFHVSERQVRRKFQIWVGMSPKRFSRIIRFLYMMDSAKPAIHFNWSNLAVQAGYFDQAHFIREFKSFSGLRPSVFLDQYQNNHTECPIYTIQDPRKLVSSN